MTTFYELWDDYSGNRLGEFPTMAEAQAVLLDVLNTSGPEVAGAMAILAYRPNAAGEYEPTTVLEGTQFVNRHLATA